MLGHADASRIEPHDEKTCLRVLLKLTRTAKESSLSLEILDLASTGILLPGQRITKALIRLCA